MGKALSRLRWVARIWSIASVALVVLFIIGERSLPTSRMGWLDFVFFPFGTCVGLCLAWRRERLGGCLAVGSFAAFYLVRFLSSGTFPQGVAWLFFAAPGPLYLLCWIASRQAGALPTTPPLG